jgi:hypothetical protein
MKIKSSLLLGLSALVIGSSGFISKVLENCESLFPMREGVSYELSNYNAKGKFQSKSAYQILSMSDVDGGKEATLHNDVKDEKDQIISSADFTVRCKGTIFYMDMKRFVSPEMTSAYKGMDVQMEGDFLQYPSAMKAGDKLPDGNLKMKVLNKGQAFADMDMKMTNRIVKGTEAVKVPAGSFNATLVEYDFESSTKMMNMSLPAMTMHVKEWLVYRNGIVRSEVQDKNGKMTSYSELTNIKN